MKDAAFALIALMLMFISSTVSIAASDQQTATLSPPSVGADISGYYEGGLGRSQKPLQVRVVKMGDKLGPRVLWFRVGVKDPRQSGVGTYTMDGDDIVFTFTKSVVILRQEGASLVGMDYRQSGGAVSVRLVRKSPDWDDRALGHQGCKDVERHSENPKSWRAPLGVMDLSEGQRGRQFATTNYAFCKHGVFVIVPPAAP